MKKDTIITIRLPQNELYDLDKKAEQANSTRSMFVRSVIRESATSEMKNTAEIINGISKISYLNSFNSDHKTKAEIALEVTSLCQFLK